MIRHEFGDLFESGAHIIAHQVNCQGVMGSGVAKQVKERFPYAYRMYSLKCQPRWSKGKNLLGHNQYVLEFPTGGSIVYIVNMFAQDQYGYDGRRYTDYEAFRNCLADLKSFVKNTKCPEDWRIAMPYRIGCDRGGGDWNTVYKIIEEELGDLNVTLYELPKN